MDLKTQHDFRDYFIEVKPKAIKVLVDIYMNSESEKMKSNAAYALFTKLPLSEFEDVIKNYSIDKRPFAERVNLILENKRRSEEKSRLMNQKRRHEKRGDFALTQDEWMETIKHFNFECVYCGDNGKLTYDHFKPFSKGGSFTKENIVPACSFCNGSKNDKDFFVWYRGKEYYDPERESRVLQFVEGRA